MSKLIFFDVDGTLTYKGTILNSAIETFNQLKSLGHKVIIATGRCKAQMIEISEIFKAYGYIYFNGKFATYGNQVLLDEPLDNDILKQLFAQLNKYKLAYSLLTANSYVTSKEDSLINDFSEHFKIVMPRKIEEADLFKEKIYSLNIYSCDDIDYIIRQFPMLTFMKVAPMAYDVIGLNCEKGQCINFFTEYLNIEHKDTIAIGDNINDLSMLLNVQNGICMGNGNDYVKKNVKFVTKDYLDDGIAYAFKEVIKLID